MKTTCKRFSYLFVGPALAVVLTVGAWADQPISPKARERLEREVRQELVRLPFYGVFDHLAFHEDGYHVHLTGRVTRPTLISDAEQAIKRIEGVVMVTDDIEVLPISPHDDRIRMAVFRALFFNGPLERYGRQANPPIHIIVKGGHVTLEWIVANEADKKLAGILTNHVPGLFSVTNNLRTGA